MLNRHKKIRLWVTLGTTVAVLAGIVSCNVINSENTGTVTSIIDGETAVISIRGSQKTVRLTNVASAHKSDCLAPEAQKFLTELLPVGSKTKLKFDKDKVKTPGVLDAIVFTEDGTMVNAEIVRQGLGTAHVVAVNDAYIEQVESAQREAEAAGRGLFGTEIECTLPAQIEAANDELERVTNVPASTTSAAAGVAIASTVTAIASAKALEALLKAADRSVNAVLWVAYTRANLASKLAALSERINQAQTKLTAKTIEKTSLEESEAKAAAQKAADDAAAAARRAADEAAQKAAEIAAAQVAAAAAAEAERIRMLPPAYVPPAPPVYVPPAQKPDSGYTGKRCYAPGGKTYRPC